MRLARSQLGASTRMQHPAHVTVSPSGMAQLNPDDLNTWALHEEKIPAFVRVGDIRRISIIHIFTENKLASNYVKIMIIISLIVLKS